MVILGGSIAESARPQPEVSPLYPPPNHMSLELLKRQPIYTLKSTNKTTKLSSMLRRRRAPSNHVYGTNYETYVTSSNATDFKSSITTMSMD
jgi:hypothetical protein